MKRQCISKKDVKKIMQDNTNWLDWRVVIREMELLVQDWCRTCLPVPEFCPELYIYHSRLQLQNQNKVGEKQQQQQQQQLNLNNHTNNSMEEVEKM